MLVLSRKEKERIFIGDNVVVTVIEINGNKVRLGIGAPKDVPVNREEVQTRKAGESGPESSEQRDSL